MLGCRGYLGEEDAVVWTIYLPLLLVRWIRCRSGWCFGYTVSGTHNGVVHVGWRCSECGRVRHYEPVTRNFFPGNSNSQEK